METLVTDRGELLKPRRALAMPTTTMVAYLAVWGTCSSSATTEVRNALLRLKGVLMADITHGIAAVVYDPEHITPQDVVKTVEDAREGVARYYRAEVLEQTSIGQALRSISARGCYTSAL